MKYGDLTLGQVEAVVNKLGGMDGVRRLLAGELTIKAKEIVFSVWKTIKLGTDFATADEFRGALKQGGFLTSDWANGLLRQPAFARSISPVPVEVELCMATTAELTGKAAGGTTAEVFAGIKRAGGDLCPAEVGPQLRVQYKDQPKGEWLFIAMEPITDSDGSPNVFSVERRGGDFWLDSYYGHPEHFWHGYYRWVFVRRPSTRA